MSKNLQICTSLNQDCKYFCPNGTCREVCSFCRNVISSCPEDVFGVMLAIMNNFRALHKENMMLYQDNIELKRLLSEMKQNQK